MVILALACEWLSLADHLDYFTRAANDGFQVAGTTRSLPPPSLPSHHHLITSHHSSLSFHLSYLQHWINQSLPITQISNHRLHSCRSGCHPLVTPSSPSHPISSPSHCLIRLHSCRSGCHPHITPSHHPLTTPSHHPLITLTLQSQATFLPQRGHSTCHPLSSPSHHPLTTPSHHPGHPISSPSHYLIRLHSCRSGCIPLIIPLITLSPHLITL